MRPLGPNILSVLKNLMSVNANQGCKEVCAQLKECFKLVPKDPEALLPPPRAAADQGTGEGGAAVSTSTVRADSAATRSSSVSSLYFR